MPSADPYENSSLRQLCEIVGFKGRKRGKVAHSTVLGSIAAALPKFISFLTQKFFAPLENEALTTRKSPEWPRQRHKKQGVAF